MKIACGLKRVSALGLLLLAGALSACSGGDPFAETPVPACPRTFVPIETSTVTQFTAGGRDLTDVKLNASIDGFNGDCAYNLDDKTLNVRISPVLSAKLGPAADGRKGTLQYFVALKDPAGKFVQKSVFDIDLDFPKDQIGVRYRDEQVSIDVPLSDVNNGPKYEIYLGFQLTRQELDYNRKFESK